MNMKTPLFALVIGASVLATAGAAELTIHFHLVTEKGPGKAIGTIIASDTAHGLLLTPKLSDLSAGIHGFHIHEHGDCGPQTKDGKVVPAGAAGGHFDPSGSGKHGGPYGDGHLGDLPVLIVDKEGKASLPVLAPRLKVSDLKNHSLMIHAGGDNYSDLPEKLGGGGARVACGIVEGPKAQE